MSTDYGFLCIECNQKSIIDNYRGYGLEDLGAILSSLDVLVAAMKVPGVYLRGEFDNHTNFATTIQFAFDHRALGHTVVIGDEYGKRLTECYERYTCPTCSTGLSCKLDRGHGGPHGVPKSVDKEQRLVDADKLEQQGQAHAAAALRGSGPK